MAAEARERNASHALEVTRAADRDAVSRRQRLADAVAQAETLEDATRQRLGLVRGAAGEAARALGGAADLAETAAQGLAEATSRPTRSNTRRHQNRP